MNKQPTKPKILIIDDNPTSLKALGAHCQSLDIEIFQAASGNEGLAYTLDHQFMVIISNIQQSEMQNDEILEVLSWDERTRHTPVILITSENNPKQPALKNYMANVVDYLTRPVHSQLVVNKVKILLEKTLLAQRLAKLQERYQSILESSDEGILGIDRSGEITFANPAVVKLLGWPIEKISGQSITSIFAHATPSERSCWQESPLYRACASGDIYKDSDASLLKFDGSTCPVAIKATPIHDGSHKLQGIILLFGDNSLTKILQDQINELAHHDHLTQLPNRVIFENELKQTLARSHRHELNSGLLFFDCDNFAYINEHFGIEVGDQLLKHIAERIQGCIRQNDTASRIAGDRFAVIIDMMTEQDDATTVAQKCLQVLSEPFYIQDKSISVKFSIGIATYPFAGTEALPLIKHAEMAMTKAKNQGGHQYCLYSPDLHDQKLNTFNIETEIEKGLEEERLYCVFEPRFAAETENIVCFDLSINWNHPTLGRITAENFLPLIAERILMKRIDNWVVDQACRQLQEWHDKEIDINRLAFCLTSVEFFQHDFIPLIRSYVENSAISASQLEVKLSEDLLAKCENYQTLLSDIKALGISITIDNFGSGPQSLSLMRNNLIDRIAIAKDLIQSCSFNERDDAIVHSIIDLAHRLNIRILAKCVEQDEQWMLLKELGCDEYFGYYFARPLIANDVPNFLHLEKSMGCDTEEI